MEGIPEVDGERFQVRLASDMGKTRLKTWGFRVVTLGLTLLLLAVVFEVGFRLAYPQYGGC